MTSQTHIALAKRASHVAEWMEIWIKELEAEIGSQQIDYLNRTGTMTLSTKQVLSMMELMRRFTNDIRKLDGKLVAKRVRSKRYPAR